MSREVAPVIWPEGKRFAFTIFDDPDGQSLDQTRLVYSFLADLGFRTTIAVWPLGASREANSGGETCANPEYLRYVQQLQAAGFEVGYHNATLHSSTRQETIRALDAFRALFGADPSAMANHYNEEAIYWGPARITGIRRWLYLALTRGATAGKHFGHVEGHPMFWGDVCRERIRYCRNLVFADIDTLHSCPWMPYEDPARPWVRKWYCASEAAQAPAFLNILSESNQDRLEQQGGASILYTHFGHGFTSGGKLNPEFRRLMERLASKNGWFVPVSVLLDFLESRRGPVVLSASQRRRLETRWLWEKMFRGTS
ncbi:MAG TPA: hypothetical protein VMG40_04580 [Bryobacteraceae bacterium]|nr:hypothetical protein [Bryobacteraceae bacterium]